MLNFMSSCNQITVMHKPERGRQQQTTTCCSFFESFAEHCTNKAIHEAHTHKKMCVGFYVARESIKAKAVRLFIYVAS